MCAVTLNLFYMCAHHSRSCLVCLLQLPWEYVAIFDADFEVTHAAVPRWPPVAAVVCRSSEAIMRHEQSHFHCKRRCDGMNGVPDSNILKVSILV